MMRQRFTAVLLFVLVLTLVASCSKGSDSPASSSGGGGGGATTPAAPTGLAAISGGIGFMTMSWTSVSGATSYNLYWDTASGVSKTNYFSKIPNVVSPYSFGCNTLSVYFIVVTAVHSTGESAGSNEVAGVVCP